MSDAVPLPVYEPVDPVLDWSHAFISTGSVCCNNKTEKTQDYILLDQRPEAYKIHIEQQNNV